MKTKKYFFSILIFMSFFFMIAWTNDWNSIKEATQNIKTISADFIQEKHMKMLKNPLISAGAFYFKSPNSLRWEYKKPFCSILLVHNGKIKRFVKVNDKFVKDTAANLTAMQFVLKEITNWLEGKFVDNPNFDAKLLKNGQIVLVPKEEVFAKIIKKIVLEFSDKPGIIKTVTVFESKNSFTKLKFINTKINSKINENLFKLIQ